MEDEHVKRRRGRHRKDTKKFLHGAGIKVKKYHHIPASTGIDDGLPKNKP
jgi:hypothetical protein